MAIWFGNPTENPLSLEGTLVEHLGIEVLEIGNDFLKARMPVDYRTRQPMGLLHGGASVALAETLGSIGAYLCVDPEKQNCVGLEINANHLRAVSSGWVYGVARPLHVGRRTQVWEIKITNEEDKLVCISRITIAVIDEKK
ncbi:MAG: hotdog fold thioesterase [Pseudomonadota bacterium]